MSNCLRWAISRFLPRILPGEEAFNFPDDAGYGCPLVCRGPAEGYAQTGGLGFALLFFNVQPQGGCEGVRGAALLFYGGLKGKDLGFQFCDYGGHGGVFFPEDLEFVEVCLPGPEGLGWDDDALAISG